jgi:hypothetical protein
LDLRARKWQEAGEHFTVRSFITCIASPDDMRAIKPRRMKWVGHVAHMRNAYKILITKPEGKKPLRRSRLRGEKNVRMDLR